MAKQYLFVCLLALAGCDQLPHKPVVPEEDLPAPVYPLRQANGSIYQGSLGSQPLFEDRRPRRVGDTLTIQLEEQVRTPRPMPAVPVPWA